MLSSCRMEGMAFTKLGVAPPDGATDVGKFRLLAGDSEYAELVPPVSGMGLYQIWTDSEIVAFLQVAGSLTRAIALAYTQIAATYAASGATIKTDDLSYSSKDSVGSWQSLAKYWSDLADKEDDKAANDMFDLVPTGSIQPWMRPEGSPRRYEEFPFRNIGPRDGLDGGTP